MLQHCDVNIPQNLDQTEISDIQNKPLNQPIQTTFQIIQIQWAKLIGKVWDTCFAARRPTYGSLFALEGQIQKLELDLPSSFRSQTLQEATERPYYVLFQNRMLTLQICHARTLLLRPCLLFPVDACSGQTDIACFQAHARCASIMFSKRLLAWQLITQNQLDRGQLSWSDSIARVFDAALTLAVAIIGDPTSIHNKELEEWIGIAQDLLRDLGTSNALAPKAFNGLEIVRQRTRDAMQPGLDLSTAPAPIPAIDQYLHKATQTIAQPQPSMSDLFEVHSYSQPLWREEVAVYPGHFPGMEALCSDTYPTPIECFLDACVPPTRF